MPVHPVGYDMAYHSMAISALTLILTLTLTLIIQNPTIHVYNPMTILSPPSLHTRTSATAEGQRDVLC